MNAEGDAPEAELPPGPPHWLSYEVIAQALQVDRDEVAATMAQMQRPVRTDEELTRSLTCMVRLLVGASNRSRRQA